MNISDLIAKLQANLALYGDLPVVCPGDHQYLYKVSGLDLTYVEDIEEYMMDEKHRDDVENFIEEGGTPSRVLAVYG